MNARAQSAHFAGTSLVIVEGDHRIRLPNLIQQDATGCYVHAVRKRGVDYFVLYAAKEWTKGRPYPKGNCGAGIESHVTWLHVRGGKIVERNRALYQSCVDNRDGYALGWHGPLFTVETEDLVEGSVTPDAKTARWRQLKWTFDVRHPEAGFAEEEKELSK